MRRRAVVITLLTWLPLLLLSVLEGHALGESVAVPFLRDWEVHIRFLAVLPLFVVAELVIHDRMRFVLRQFLERKVVPPSAAKRFEAAVGAAFRLRNSVLAGLLLIAFVYVVGISLVWRQYMTLGTPTWYAVPQGADMTLTLSGLWFGYVSLPIFQFLMLCWYYRIFIWARFLWQVSRIDLNLVPTHPDRAGGLGFLSNTAYAFVPLAAGHGAILGLAYFFLPARG